MCNIWPGHVYYIYRQKQILLGLRTCDNLQTKYNKKHDKHSTIAKNHNNCPTNLSLIPAEPALDNVMCPYPHSTSEVSPNTCQCLSISQYQRLTKMWPLHSMPCTQLQPYTPARTVMFSLVASKGHGPAVVVRGVVWYEPLARGVSECIPPYNSSTLYFQIWCAKSSSHSVTWLHQPTAWIWSVWCLWYWHG
jgi:hypothetical protein